MKLNESKVVKTSFTNITGVIEYIDGYYMLNGAIYLKKSNTFDMNYLNALTVKGRDKFEFYKVNKLLSEIKPPQKWLDAVWKMLLNSEKIKNKKKDQAIIEFLLVLGRFFNQNATLVQDFEQNINFAVSSDVLNAPTIILNMDINLKKLTLNNLVDNFFKFPRQLELLTLENKKLFFLKMIRLNESNYQLRHKQEQILKKINYIREDEYLNYLFFFLIL